MSADLETPGRTGGGGRGRIFKSYLPLQAPSAASPSCLQSKSVYNDEVSDSSTFNYPKSSHSKSCDTSNCVEVADCSTRKNSYFKNEKLLFDCLNISNKSLNDIGRSKNVLPSTSGNALPPVFNSPEPHASPVRSNMTVSDLSRKTSSFSETFLSSSSDEMSQKMEKSTLYTSHNDEIYTSFGIPVSSPHTDPIISRLVHSIVIIICVQIIISIYDYI